MTVKDARHAGVLENARTRTKRKHDGTCCRLEC